MAEGIAQRRASGDVPFRLANKKLYLLDLTALIAGTQFRGQFESRVKGLVEDIKEAGNVILFIDEVHNLVGAGDSEGSMNAANILKPALSRGEIQVIGATTFNEYRKNIEKDAALERRFQPVTIEEPSVSDAVDVIKGIKGYYEQHHRWWSSTNWPAWRGSVRTYIPTATSPTKRLTTGRSLLLRCPRKEKHLRNMISSKRKRGHG